MTFLIKSRSKNDKCESFTFVEHFFVKTLKNSENLLLLLTIFFGLSLKRFLKPVLLTPLVLLKQNVVKIDKILYFKFFKRGLAVCSYHSAFCFDFKKNRIKEYKF